MSMNAILNRQANQAARISAGISDGSLTKPEALKLVGQQLATDKMIVSAKVDDGFVGPKERAEIRGSQARNSADIFQQRHDGQVARQPSGHPRVERQQNQAQRISAGVKDGSLTLPEAGRLVRAELRTGALMAHSKLDDGKIGPVESARIEARQDATSAAIFRQRHDAQTRG